MNKSVLRYMLRSPMLRALLNRKFAKFDFEQHAQAHRRYYNLYHGQPTPPYPATWYVHYKSAQIKFPFELWEQALSVLGYDVEVKRFYDKCLHWNIHTRMFVDVGANYGTHSLMFLAKGVPVIAIEPNPICVSHFTALARMNKFTDLEIIEAAVSDKGDKSVLYSPEGKPWLGIIGKTLQCAVEHKQLSDHAAAVAEIPLTKAIYEEPLTTFEVKVVKLDDVLQNLPRHSIIKLDIEGYELEALVGCSRTILRAQPHIVFECYQSTRRSDIQSFFQYNGYEIRELRPTGDWVVDRVQFIESKATNFVAVAR